MDQASPFLRRLLISNSGTLNLEGVKEVGTVFDQAFQEIGFQTQWIDMPAEMNRAGHFFASY